MIESTAGSGCRRSRGNEERKNDEMHARLEVVNGAANERNAGGHGPPLSSQSLGASQKTLEGPGTGDSDHSDDVTVLLLGSCRCFLRMRARAKMIVKNGVCGH